VVSTFAPAHPLALFICHPEERSDFHCPTLLFLDVVNCLGRVCIPFCQLIIRMGLVLTSQRRNALIEAMCLQHINPAISKLLRFISKLLLFVA
jgi:hypothetical protein